MKIVRLKKYSILLVEGIIPEIYHSVFPGSLGTLDIWKKADFPWESPNGVLFPESRYALLSGNRLVRLGNRPWANFPMCSVDEHNKKMAEKFREIGFTDFPRVIFGGDSIEPKIEKVIY